MSNVTPIVSRTGQLAFRGEERGPRGGVTPWYAPRSEGQTQPGAWVIWSPRLRDVSDGDVAGTGARI